MADTNETTRSTVVLRCKSGCECDALWHGYCQACWYTVCGGDLAPDDLLNAAPSVWLGGSRA